MVLRCRRLHSAAKARAGRGRRTGHRRRQVAARRPRRTESRAAELSSASTSKMSAPRCRRQCQSAQGRAFRMATAPAQSYHRPTLQSRRLHQSWSSPTIERHSDPICAPRRCHDAVEIAATPASLGQHQACRPHHSLPPARSQHDRDRRPRSRRRLPRFNPPSRRPPHDDSRGDRTTTIRASVATTCNPPPRLHLPRHHGRVPYSCGTAGPPSFPASPCRSLCSALSASCTCSATRSTIYR